MNGLILIPDISGFTKFVNSVNNDLGVSVISELLAVIIENNDLSLELSEIEGDALLFYKTDSLPDTKMLFQTCSKMFTAFSAKWRQLKKTHQLSIDLSLKFIIHYGTVNVFDLKGFRKLYGNTVIESHSLLKNGKGKSDYILITDNCFNNLKSVGDVYISDWAFDAAYAGERFGASCLSYQFYNFKPASRLSA